MIGLAVQLAVGVAVVIACFCWYRIGHFRGREDERSLIIRSGMCMKCWTKYAMTVKEQDCADRWG